MYVRFGEISAEHIHYPYRHQSEVNRNATGILGQCLAPEHCSRSIAAPEPLQDDK